MGQPPKVERWRPVVGHEVSYEVSNRGRVRRTTGRVLTPTPNSHGYLMVTVGGRPRRVHHLVLEAFVGARPSPSSETRHKDGNPAHNWPSNLLWGTRAENAADKRRHGTHNHTRQSACRRRGHPLAGANLEKWAAQRGHRACLACNRGYGDVVYYGRQGIHYDRDVLADQYYAWLVEGGPRPRSTSELREAASVADGAGWEPGRSPRRAGQWTPRVTWVIEHDFEGGAEFRPPDVHDRVRARGLDVSANAITNALTRAVRNGLVEKLARGRYRRVSALAGA